ncbi:tetraspanin-10 isoform X4 [Nymphaea colorata]|uniref:tetraspanin-10 isoform X4 n=1 Tax=Nymphaea colorata TaxID=210225 RepID=UPI00129E6202|nr:tetraspanin-10 isoform X4 [Nymphaea colorata]
MDQPPVHVGVMGYGVWMSSQHDDCRRFLALPVLALGAVVLVISLFGFVGALKNVAILLWLYLLMLCLILLAILVVTVLAFIVINNGTGHTVPGQRYKEYQLSEYSSLFKKQLNNKHYWEHLKSCLVRPDDCKNLAKEYKMLKQYKAAILTPIEAGCCRPPSECGFPAINASFYDLSFHPVSTNKDCKIYKNSVARKCYDCDSCKAGVAEYMKTKWKVVAIFNVILFVVLAAIYMVGCCARRNVSRVRSDKP